MGSRGAFIIMEHLGFGSRADMEELGRSLARMHLAEPSVNYHFYDVYVCVYVLQKRGTVT